MRRNGQRRSVAAVAAEARADVPAAHQPHDAPERVHAGRAGIVGIGGPEISAARVGAHAVSLQLRSERAGQLGSEPAVHRLHQRTVRVEQWRSAHASPDEESEDRIDQPRIKERIEEICLEPEALGKDRAGDRRRSDAEGERAEEAEQVDVGQRSEAPRRPGGRGARPADVAGDGVVQPREHGARPGLADQVAEGPGESLDGEAHQPEGGGGDGGVREHLGADVRGVLGPHRSGLEQEEAALHEEDEREADRPPADGDHRGEPLELILRDRRRNGKEHAPL